MSRGISVCVRRSGPSAVRKLLDRGKAVWAALPAEERSYLLPFGADRDRQQLEQSTVTYEPVEEFNLGTVRPAFEVSGHAPLALPPASEAPIEVSQETEVAEETLAAVQEAARTLGFKTEPRSLPPGASVRILDLFAMPRETVKQESRRRSA